MFDLDAYLQRIGLAADVRDLAEIHRAHVTSIPFENLDPCRGVPVSLTLDALQDKLVRRRRGGYCFEQNSLLMAALRALGLTVEPMLARVRWGTAPTQVNGLTHLVLRVHAGASDSLADAGFGFPALIEPIPFGVGGPYEQLGWRYRVRADGEQLVLQCATRTGWRAMYAFVPRPALEVDIEQGNWWVCTNPRSRFVSGLTVTATRPDGTRITLSGGLAASDEELELTTHAPSGSATACGSATAGGSATVSVRRERLGELLRERFGLDGFTLTSDGQLRYTWPRAGASCDERDCA